MNNSTEIAPLFASNEVMGTFLSAHAQSDPSVVNQLKADPKAALSSLTACDVLSVTPDIQVVENSDTTIHLMLPYYSLVELMDVEALSDTDMDMAGGFEIIFLIIGALAGSLGAIGGALGVGSATAAEAIGSSIAVGGLSAGLATGLAGGGAAIAAGAAVVGTGIAAAGAVAGTAVGVGISEGEKAAARK